MKWTLSSVSVKLKSFLNFCPYIFAHNSLKLPLSLPLCCATCITKLILYENRWTDYKKNSVIQTIRHPIRTRIIWLKFYKHWNSIFTFLLFVFYSCYHGRLTYRGRPGGDLRGSQWSRVFVSHWFVISSDFSKSTQIAKLANWLIMTVKNVGKGF